MGISRILRVLLTIILIVSFIGITIAAYRQNQDTEAMTELSDATTSIATKLTSEELAWEDSDGVNHPFILDSDKLAKLENSKIVAGENYVFHVQIVYLKTGSEQRIGNFDNDIPSNKMTCALSFPTALRRNALVVPAKLRLISWKV